NGSAKNERDEDGIVELSGYGDEVRHEVERQREIRNEHGEQNLVSALHSRVAQQAPEQHYAVGDEPSHRPRLLATAEEHEPDDEDGVDDEHRADDDEPDLNARHGLLGKDRATALAVCQLEGADRGARPREA